MIVECQNCTTRFQLDESRIPLAGIRVRCSRCKEAFFLDHPSATQAEAVDELALDAAANEEMPAPGSTQDLVAPLASASAPPFEAEDDEDDWEFNHEEPEEAPAPPPRAPLGGETGSSGIELAGSPGVESAAATSSATHPAENSFSDASSAATPEAVLSDDQISFDDSEVDISGIDIEGIGDTSDTSGTSDTSHGFDPAAAQAETETMSVADAGFESDSALDADSAFDHSATSDLSGVMHPDGSVTQEPVLVAPAAGVSDPTGDLGEAAALPAADAVSADLGEPEDWDLLGEDLPAPPVTERVLEAPAAPEAATTHMASPHAAAVGAPVSLSVGRPTLRLQSGLHTAGMALGWILTLSLLGATLWEGVRTSVASASAPATTEFEVGRLVARSVQTAWVPTREGRTLLAVRGELHNPTASVLKPQYAVMISLLDANGLPLDIPELKAGRTIDADALRDLPATAREQLGMEASDALSAVSLAGGGSVPFAAYFSDVPAEARRVLVAGVEPELAYDDGQNLPWADPVAAELD